MQETSVDLSSITATANTVEIRHPATAEPIGLTITLRPPTHPDVKAVNRKLMNETLKARNGKLTAEKLEANSLDRLVAATESFAWSGDASWNGQKLEATRENILTVYTKAPWIKTQVDEALGDEASFFRGTD